MHHLTLGSPRATLLALALTCATPAAAQTVSNFDNDALGPPPSTGGLNEPTSFTVNPGSVLAVSAAAFGVNTQPVRVGNSGGLYTALNWDFPPVNFGRYRVEATISASHVFNAYTLQTSGGGFVTSRLQLNDQGEIFADAFQIGTYTPGVPFRVRVDLDLATLTYDVTLDPEFDAFADNQTFTGIPFTNPGIVTVDAVHASINQTVGLVPDGAVAYDDVYHGPLCVGQPFCTAATANSTGLPGQICATGSIFANQNLLTLEASDLPPNRFGYFLVAPLQNFVAFPGGSQGILCLGGTLGRFASQIQNSGATGRYSIVVDTTNLPLLGPILPGSQFHFQSWYRDLNPGPTSNFTTAVSISFL